MTTSPHIGAEGSTTAAASSAHWWLLAAALATCPLVLATPWAVLVQVAVLGMAVHRLSRRPPRGEAATLWVVIGLIISFFLVAAAISVAVAGLTATFSGTAVTVG